MTKILVTGGAGYIGSHTAKYLATRGFEPVVLDNLSTGNRTAVKWGPFIEGDIGDKDLVLRTIREHRVEAVIHFAASAYVGESMEKPAMYFRNNVANTLALLDALVESDIRNIVFSSTCATYGHPRSIPIDESHPQAPVNPYGESKLFVERALGWYEKAYGLRFVALRYFNAAGADPEGEIGELHTPETHLIPLAIAATQEDEPRLVVFGTDYDTPDGTAVRDYIHVQDLADAHHKALVYLLRGGQSTSVNLGTETGHSVLEVINTVQKVSGLPVRFELRNRRPGDPAVLVANAARAREVLGWSSRFADLEHIASTAWEWHKKARLDSRLSSVGYDHRSTGAHK